MRHQIQLVPNDPSVSAAYRLTSTSVANLFARRRPRSPLENLRGAAVGLGLMVWLACSGAPVPSQAPAEEGAQAPVEDSSRTPAEETGAFIVQGKDLATALEAVRQVGGEVTHELGVIRAVGARLTERQRAALEELEGITRIYEDRPVRTQQGFSGNLESGE